MLPFYYTFLILALSSSVIAVPPIPPVPARTRGHNQKDEESKLLIHSKDVRLPRGLWSRVGMLPAEDTSTGEARKSAGEGPGDNWTGEAQYLDDVLQFAPVGGTSVEEVVLRRIVREMMKTQTGPAGDIIKDAYRVVRKHRSTADTRPATTRPLLTPPSRPIRNCRSYLHDTYWGRNPKILGTLKSGPQNLKDWGTVIHIKWIGPAGGVEVPYITFIPPTKLKGINVLRAKEYYLLNEMEAILTGQPGHVWEAGFMSPIPAFSSSVIAKLAPYYQDENESRFLLDNKDGRLRKGLWGRLRMPGAGPIATWSNAQDLDEVIQFESVKTSLGARKVNVGRIYRKLMPKPDMPIHNGYCVVRTHHGGVVTFTFQLDLAIENSKLYDGLHDSYWGRIPEILGENQSGPRKDWEHFIYIHWTFSATYKKAVPHVTFLRTEYWPNLLRAKDCYDSH